MSFEVKGRLLSVTPVEHKGKDGNFAMREFVVEVPGKYPQKVKFQLVQDRCSLIDQYAINSDIAVSFDIRGQEWQGKVFNNLNAWKIEPMYANNQAHSYSTSPPPPSASHHGNTVHETRSGDTPF